MSVVVRVGRDVRDWLIHRYDRVLLSTALVALLFSVLFLLLQVNDEVEGLRQGSWIKGPVDVPQVAPLDLATRRALVDLIGHPYQAALSEKRLLVSQERVTCVNPPCLKPIPYDVTPCPFCQSVQPPPEIGRIQDDDGDGLTNQQEIDLGLDPNDPTDARADWDGDGFDNSVELEAGTDLYNRASYPAPHHLLRLIRAKATPFRMIFESVSELEEGRQDFGINVRTIGRTYFRGLNEEVEGYLIESYDPDAAAGPTLTLRNGDDQIELVKGQITIDKTWKALLLYTQEMREISVHTGLRFQILDNSYIVFDINPAEVIILDTISEERITVRRIAQDEFEEFKRRQSEGWKAESRAVRSDKRRGAP